MTQLVWTRRTIQSPDEAGAARRFLAAAAWTLFATSAALVVFLVARRLTGAIIQPLSAAAMLFAAALLLGMSLAGQRLILPAIVALVLHRLRPASAAWHGPGRLAIEWAVPAMVAVLGLAAVTRGDSPPWGVALAWLIVVAGEAASLLWLTRDQRRIVGQASGPAHRQSAALQPGEGRASDPDADDELPAGLVQQLTRVRDCGRESIHALLCTCVPAGDRLAVIHVAFCPPLDSAPELTAHCLDRSDLDVRIAQCETFGARIEVRASRSEAAARQAVIEIMGSAACR